MQCANNLKQQALACHNFHNDHNFFPPGFYYGCLTGYPAGAPYVAAFGSTVPGLYTDYGSWVVMILPYIEQGNVQWPTTWTAYTGITPTLSFFNLPAYQAGVNGPSAAAGQALKVMECPSYTVNSWVNISAPSPPSAPLGLYEAQTSYLACYGTMSFGTPAFPAAPIKNRIFNYGSMTRILDVTDGASNTILLGERCSIDPCTNTFQVGTTGAWFGSQSNTGGSTPVAINFQRIWLAPQTKHTSRPHTLADVVGPTPGFPALRLPDLCTMRSPSRCS